jgi:AraC-like DNA-binding protein
MHFFYSKTDHEASGPGAIDEFEYLNDFGFERYRDIRQKRLKFHYNEGIEICFVTSGRYEWVVGNKTFLLLPGDGFITCPWQKHGSPREVVDMGEIYWVVIKPFLFNKNGEFDLGTWTRFTAEENRIAGEILCRNANHILRNARELKDHFERLQHETHNKEFGYQQRVANIIEDFLVSVVRMIRNRENKINEYRNWFIQFDHLLSSNIAKKWTLQEMAEKSNMGITSLTQRVKEYTGYSPASYLTYIRLEKAKKMLSGFNENLTSIALDCGFYSSQHFSGTFSKWVGITPSAFRKKAGMAKKG